MNLYINGKLIVEINSKSFNETIEKELPKDIVSKLDRENAIKLLDNINS